MEKILLPLSFVLFVSIKLEKLVGGCAISIKSLQWNGLKITQTKVPSWVQSFVLRSFHVLRLRNSSEIWAIFRYEFGRSQEGAQLHVFNFNLTTVEGKIVKGG